MLGQLKKPKPVKVGTTKNPKSYSIFAVGSIQKNGGFSSARDLSGGSASKNHGNRKAKTHVETSGDATMFPLLSEVSGYGAALMPEIAGGSSHTTPQKQENASKLHLRFPILSPTREESLVLTRMKTMHR